MPIKIPQSLKTENRLIVRIDVDRISGVGPAYGKWS
jgi:hypothetical protein